jgi:hypothetical protein
MHPFGILGRSRLVAMIAAVTCLAAAAVAAKTVDPLALAVGMAAAMAGCGLLLQSLTFFANFPPP